MDDNGFIGIGKIVVFFAHFSLILSALPLPLISSVFLFAYVTYYLSPHNIPSFFSLHA
jgi:hypothetical protein